MSELKEKDLEKVAGGLSTDSLSSSSLDSSVTLNKPGHDGSSLSSSGSDLESCVKKLRSKRDSSSLE